MSLESENQAVEQMSGPIEQMADHHLKSMSRFSKKAPLPRRKIEKGRLGAGKKARAKNKRQHKKNMAEILKNKLHDSILY